MAYDEDLADRLRAVLRDEDGVREARMFGGLAFLLGGNLAISASSQGGLLVRCDPAEAAVHVAVPGVTPFEMRGREMGGWLHVTDEAIPDEQSLERWVAVGAAYARSLPAKHP